MVSAVVSAMVIGNHWGQWMIELGMPSFRQSTQYPWAVCNGVPVIMCYVPVTGVVGLESVAGSSEVSWVSGGLRMYLCLSKNEFEKYHRTYLLLY